MIVAKTLGGFKIEKVQRISFRKPVSSGANHNSNQSDFHSILTTIVYEKKEKNKDSNNNLNLISATPFESYNKEAHLLFSYSKHQTDIRC